jgi:TPR repeat protein
VKINIKEKKMKWILLIMLSLSALQTIASTSADFKIYTNSAEQGVAGAQYNLGVMYYKGQGITQNYKQAFDWYSKAAAQGNDADYLIIN